MSRFIQIHALTIYAPSNLNRDDTGRPKTAKFGGAERLRISSQALKRAIRTSEDFKLKLYGHMGDRTARAGDLFRADLIGHGVEANKATLIAKTLSALLGKADKEKEEPLVRSKELFFMAPEEWAAFKVMAQDISRDKVFADELASIGGSVEDEAESQSDEDEATKAKKGKEKVKTLSKKRADELRAKLLVTIDTAADIAMFGRMVASAPKYNREAAVQIAHAITTHKVEVEDDFYTAVDDLKKPAEDAGAGFIGELGFGSGVFYLYACIDRAQLEKNLGGDKNLSRTAIAALVEGLLTTSPSGKQNSFASRSAASYACIQKGHQQPCNLAAAFLKPVRGEDLLNDSIQALEDMSANMAKVYGPRHDAAKTMNLLTGTETLAELITFAAGD